LLTSRAAFFLKDPSIGVLPYEIRMDGEETLIDCQELVRTPKNLAVGLGQSDKVLRLFPFFVSPSHDLAHSASGCPRKRSSVPTPASQPEETHWNCWDGFYRQRFCQAAVPARQ
jgi:hypothetical protein